MSEGSKNAGTLRRSSFVTLAISTLAYASCGHQVTPDPSSASQQANLGGKILLRFRTLGAMDFSNYTYVVVFNTNPSSSNSTNVPYANAWLTGTYNNFSYAFAVGAQYGGLTALPALLQYYLPAGATNLRANLVAPSPSLTSFQPNDNGQGTEFTLIFDRMQLNLPSPYTPSPSPSPTPSPTPTATPTNAPSMSPTPVPTATPVYGPIWYYNFFTLDRSGNPVDALGLGVNDNTFAGGPFDITTQFQLAIFRPAGYPQVNAAAQIVGGEIDNYL